MAVREGQIRQTIGEDVVRFRVVGVADGRVTLEVIAVEMQSKIGQRQTWDVATVEANTLEVPPFTRSPDTL